MKICPISELLKELSAGGLTGKIVVSGGFRAPSEPGKPLPTPLSKVKSPLSMELLEIDGLFANTVKVLLKEPTITQNSPNEKQFQGKAATNTDADKMDVAATQPETSVSVGSVADWWSSWSTTFVAAGILNPVVDAGSLFSLLRERKRLRVFCDTNALAGGVATWCAEVFAGRIDFVTSAVVDREVMAWAQTKDSRQAKTLKAFHERTRYLLSYQLTENSPEGVVIERLAPDQSALMLAKTRDEAERVKGEPRTKSNDADILLMELARAYVRDAPRNTRVVFLTGDRALARAATSTLGGDAVLYASASTSLAKDAQDKVFGRGWWVPGGVFGTIKRPSFNHVLWSLLAPCEYLVLSDSRGAEYMIYQKFSGEEGVPSEWNSPLIEVRQLSAPMIAKVTRTTGGPLISAGSLPEWILPEVVCLPAEADVPEGGRVYPEILFETLGRVLFGSYPQWEKRNVDSRREVSRSLVILGAITEDLQPGPQSEKFRSLWRENLLDELHAEFLRLPKYREAIELVRRASLSPNEVPPKYESFLGLARRLGQVAKLNEKISWGAAPLRTQELLNFLERAIPAGTPQERTEVVCEFALRELRVTPARFEQAMTALWQKYPEAVPFRPEVGGTPSKKDQQEVILFSSRGTFEFRSTIPGALMFGGSTPAQAIARKL